MTRATYTPAQREAVIRDWATSGKLLKELAHEHGVPMGTAGYWIYKARLRGDSRVPMLSDAELGERRHRSRRAR